MTARGYSIPNPIEAKVTTSGLDFNLSDLFKTTFNVYAQIPVYFPKGNDDTEDELILEGTIKHSEQTGIPMWDYFQFEYPKDGAGDTTASLGSGLVNYDMPDTTVCELDLERRTVITEMVKTKDVIEIIGDGLWRMVFRGFIINTDSDTYPTSRVKDMLEMFKVGVSIKAISKFLNDKDIHDIVITSLRLPAMPGFANVQAFEITAIEDVPIELILKDSN